MVLHGLATESRVPPTSMRSMDHHHIICFHSYCHQLQGISFFKKALPRNFVGELPIDGEVLYG